MECVVHSQNHGVKKELAKQNSINIFNIKTSYAITVAKLFLCISQLIKL